MEKEQLCEASRAPNCSSIVINDDDIAKEECKRAYGLGSQCRPNECLFGYRYRDTYGTIEYVLILIRYNMCTQVQVNKYHRE